MASMDLGCFTGNTQADKNCFMKKRKVDDCDDMNCVGNERMDVVLNNNRHIISRGHSSIFLHLMKEDSTYQTENWRASGNAVFSPISHSVFINLLKYDEVTTAQGSFSTADQSGNFSGTATGDVIHLWRYNDKLQRLYISKSLLITNSQVFQSIQSHLLNT